MAVINYDRQVSNYINGLNATGHVTHTKHKKKSVTIHHNAGRMSHQGVLDVWKTRPASAHFDVDGNGAVAQYVDVNEYAWATGNTQGNQESISIEMCNSAVGGKWPVSDVTWKSAARLTAWLFAKVIGTAPTNLNVHYHRDWSATGCPGDYMVSIRNVFLKEVQAQYAAFTGSGSSTSTQATPNRNLTLTQVAQEVIDNKWGNGDDRRTRLFRAGYNATTVQNEVNRILGASHLKATAVVADEVIAGKWGVGVDRRNRLTQAGYSYPVIQAEVNRRVK